MFRLHLVFFSKPCLKHATTNLFSLKRCFCYFLRINLRHTSSWNDELFLVSTILRTRALPIVLMKTQSVILCFVPPPTGCIDALHHCRIITLMLQKDIFHMITWCISLWKVLASTKLTVWKYVLVLVLLTAADNLGCGFLFNSRWVQIFVTFSYVIIGGLSVVEIMSLPPLFLHESILSYFTPCCTLKEEALWNTVNSHLLIFCLDLLVFWATGSWQFICLTSFRYNRYSSYSAQIS